MYFHKIDHPFNFVPTNRAEVNPLPGFGSDVFLISFPTGEADLPVLDGILGSLPRPNQNHDLQTGDSQPAYTAAISDTGFSLHHSSGARVVVSHPVMPFGTSGQKWMLSFSRRGVDGFYGMGEKNIVFEKSRVRTKFWNTDVWADFAGQAVEWGSTDPMYASFPVLIIHTNGHWVALILPGSYPAFMDTGAKQVIEGVKDPGVDLDFFYLGATGPAGSSETLSSQGASGTVRPGNTPAPANHGGSTIEGAAHCIIAAAENLVDLIPKVNRIAGLPKRLPLWALGYQQSRWGYSSLSELEALSGEFLKREIPCDGLWLDIDYMHEYRVFTLNHHGFDKIQPRISKLRQAGRRVVPILDPGLKREDENPLVDQAISEGLFCLNPSGRPYVGFVWPGASYFPDFSLEKTRTWWAEQTAKLAKLGFSGFWVDMNDPSTGSSSLEDMLFSGGRYPHEAYHNDYGRDMTRATVEGLLMAYPERRPFVLSRSGSLGSSRWGTLWTGDNMSNYHHLTKGIEMVLSLSLSGMPLIGMDVGGFGGDCSAELAVDWHRASFLLPIFRNHSAAGTTSQEPWQFDAESLNKITQAIRSRYVLLPYLYQQMVSYTTKGEPIVRPMLYHHWNELTRDCADQFYIGPHILQAPRFQEGQESRNITVPPGEWAGLFTNHLISGPKTEVINLEEQPFPVYLKAGAIIPLQAWAPEINSSDQVDLRSPSFMVYPGRGDRDWQQPEMSEYLFDDPDGWGYTSSREVLRWFVQSKAGKLEIRTETQGRHPANFDLYIFATPAVLRINGVELTPEPAENPVPGSMVPVWKVGVRV